MDYRDSGMNTYRTDRVVFSPRPSGSLAHQAPIDPPERPPTLAESLRNVLTVLMQADSILDDMNVPDAEDSETRTVPGPDGSIRSSTSDLERLSGKIFNRLVAMRGFMGSL